MNERIEFKKSSFDKVSDIKDLLGVRRNKSAKHVGGGFMFSDLIRNILKASNLRLEREEGIQSLFPYLLRCNPFPLDLADVLSG